MKTQHSNHPKVNSTRLQTTPVAIIGMASIFPEASNMQEYWDNIIRKIDCVMDVPASRWSIEDYYDPNPSTPDKTYCKRGGFIPDIDFDPVEFGLPPNILEVTDVAQLLGLVVAKEAMEDAGYSEKQAFNRDQTGVILGFVGMGTKLYTPLLTRLQYPVWEKVLRSYGLPEEQVQEIVGKMKSAYVNWEENAFPGTIGNVVAGRIANRLDLGGTNCVVDAACGSSLAAVKLAYEELVSGRAEMMITGGVDTDNSIGAYMCFSKTPAFSKSDRVRPFDAQSDGMMVGEGLGMFVLKRLADAERDHDRIYAVIKGVGSSSDGRYKSIYAPRPEGQAKALRRAYQEAGYDPATVGLIEAHGTGTMAGDPAEFEALREVFSENNPRTGYIALGSVKSQIGHTKGAAGAASMMKAALALYHKVLPATINVQQPNPKLKIEQTPFYINTETRPWIRPVGAPPRRAGVSSFGFGGTNFHIALEEYEPETSGTYRLNRVARSILLSAASPEQLQSTCEQAFRSLQGKEAQAAFEALCTSTEQEVPADAARLGFLASSIADALDLLQTCILTLQQKVGEESWDHPKGIYYRKAAADPTGKVVALFSGQGSQYVNMGRELAVNFPEFRKAYAEIDGLFLDDRLEPLSSHVFPTPVFDPAQKEVLSQTLQQTQFAQPAIGTTSLAFFSLLRAAGLKPDVAAGHSFGELTALWAAGVLDDRGYFTLAKARGKAMAPPADPDFDAGAMLAVKGDIEKIRAELPHLPGVILANHNSNNQAVLAGPKAAIADAQKTLSEKGYTAVVLPVSAAFHTPLVGHAQEPFAQVIQATKFHKPALPVYSNTTGQAYPTQPDAIRTILTDHILKPVLFKDEIETIYSQGGRIFIEFGPKNVLTKLVQNILAGKAHIAIALNANHVKDSDLQLREAVIQLRVAGLSLHSIDPYPRSIAARSAKKHSPVTIQLNGGLYVSPKTKAAFAEALRGNQGKLSLSAAFASQPQATLSTPASKKPDSLSKTTLEPTEQNSHGTEQNLMAPQQSTFLPILETLTRYMDQIQTTQKESLHVHEQYLATQAEYAHSFTQLMQTGYALFSPTSPASSVPQSIAALESIERSLSRYHDHAQESLRVHEQYLQNQLEFSKQLFNLIQQQQNLLLNGRISIPTENPAFVPAVRPETLPAPEPMPKVETRTAASSPAPGTTGKNGSAPISKPAAPALTTESPAPASTPSTTTPLDVEAISKALFEVVSEKTGYPVEMLEPGMDMEADLGIDSIKRVEILGAMQTRFPALPKVEPEALSELRTLGQIVDRLGANPVNTASTVEPASTPVEKIPEPPQAVQPAASLLDTPQSSAPMDVETITQALISVVSEKTGYPPEMLELNMDMEADLGIDSIKRVEILGTMQTQFPDLPKVEPEVLSEMRTLGQIIDHMSQSPKSETVSPVKEAAVAESHPFPLVPSGVVRVKPLPEPDRLNLPPANGQVFVITDDGTDLTGQVAVALQENGWKPVVLSFPKTVIARQANLSQGIARIELEEPGEESITHSIEVIHQQFGAVAGFLHLNPANDAAGAKEIAFPEREKAIVKHVFLLAKHLKSDLNQPCADGRNAFLAIVHLGGEFGAGINPAGEPISGGLFGLVKTLNLEWPSVFCRAVDLGQGLQIDATVHAILAELFDPNRLITEVGYGPQGRVTLIVSPFNEVIHVN